MAKRKPAKKVQRSEDYAVQFYIDSDTGQAFEEFIASRPADERPTKRSVFIAALQAYLQARGHWPPKGGK